MPGSRTILSTVDFSKAFNSVCEFVLFHKLISAGLPSCLMLVGLNLSFLIGALAWFIKITKVAPFESVEVSQKDPCLALYFSLFSSIIFLLLCLLPSAALFTLTISLFGPSPVGPHCGGGHTKSCVLIGALVGVLVSSFQSEQM